MGLDAEEQAKFDSVQTAFYEDESLFKSFEAFADANCECFDDGEEQKLECAARPLSTNIAASFGDLLLAIFFHLRRPLAPFASHWRKLLAARNAALTERVCACAILQVPTNLSEVSGGLRVRVGQCAPRSETTRTAGTLIVCMLVQHWGSLLIGMCVTELMQMG